MCDVKTTKDFLSIASWNICGIKNKINNPDFIEEILPHDIIILSETFADNDQIHFQGYKCKNVCYSKKHKKAKRHSGGISVLIKIDISHFVTIVKTTAEHFIWLKINKKLTGYAMDTYCCCAYIPPYDSPYYEKHPNLNLFEMLNEDLLKFNKLGHIMISGDLNTRVGLKSDTILNSEMNSHSDELLDTSTIKAPPRCSMDTKTNTWGNNLIDICIAHNICLLNGRTIGDYEGRFTFFGVGCSTIDVTIVDEQILSSILSFKVHPLTEHSSHCKIETILACSSQLIPDNDPTIANISFDKYTWNNDVSPEKLCTALKSQEFITLKEKICSSFNQKNSNDTDALNNDVTNLFKSLHDQCCDKIRIGKKSHAKAKRQKWFKPDCIALRKLVRRSANYFNRNPFNRQARDDYFSLNRKYRKLLKKTKKEYLESNMRKLIQSTDKHEMWSILSDIRGKKMGESIPMKELHSHFSSLLNNPPKTIKENKLNFLNTKLNEFIKNDSPQQETLSSGGYTPEFISKIAQKTKNGKSGFLDGSINEVIKHSINETAPVFAKLFNHIESSTTFPTAWKSSFLVPLHKKGSRSDPDNYRGLAVGSNIGKLYTKCLNTKLKTFVESKNIISQHQFGFRDDYRTSDAIFSLRSMVSYYKNSNNKPVYACFVDFRKAFDSVNRTALAYKLGSVGIRGNMLKLFQNMYNNANYVIKSHGKFSIPLDSKIGVK